MMTVDGAPIKISSAHSDHVNEYGDSAGNENEGGAGLVNCVTRSEPHSAVQLQLDFESANNQAPETLDKRAADATHSREFARGWNHILKLMPTVRSCTQKADC